MPDFDRDPTLPEAGAEIVGVSSCAEPAAALAEALYAVQAGLGAAGAGPHHLVHMRWEAREPAAVHPSRHAVDLAYREVFAGFRPPIELVPAGEESPVLTIRARHRLPEPPAGTPVHGGYTAAELARQYSPRLQADMRRVFRDWTRDGTAFRAAHGGLDLAYGTGRFETLDLYRPAGPGPHPVWVFVHGGYWQASDKAQHAHYAAGMLAAGFAVAMPNYGLAPETPLETSVAQTVAALAFLADEATGLGLDPDRIHVAGHSAGAHLAAMAAADPAAPPIRSALLLSGLFDLAPLGHVPIGRLLGLDDPARAAALGACRRARPRSLAAAVALGGLESAEFHRQSALMAEAWGLEAPLVLPDAHHFSLLDGLFGGPLLDLAETLARRP